MANEKREGNFALNGTKGWVFSFMFVIILQCIALGFWAGSLSKDVHNIKEDVAEIKVEIKDLKNAQTSYQEKS